MKTVLCMYLCITHSIWPFDESVEWVFEHNLRNINCRSPSAGLNEKYFFETSRCRNIWHKVTISKRIAYCMKCLVITSSASDQLLVKKWVPDSKIIKLSDWTRRDTVCFYCMPSWWLSKFIETKLETTFTSYKMFKKTKRGLKLVSLPHFLHGFWRKIFVLLCSITWPNLIVWLPFS